LASYPGGVNPYVVLGVDPRAPDREIEATYRRLLRAHHPDLHAAGTEAELEAAEARTRELTVAMDAIRVDRAFGWTVATDPPAESSSASGTRAFGDRDEEELVRRVQRLSSYNADPALFDLLVRGQGSGTSPPAGVGEVGTPDERLAALLGLTLATCTVVLLVMVLFEWLA
jgi:hypothetical protein